MTNITLFAQPYDISCVGFYFETIEQYELKAAGAVNDFGQRVEEFEIQFIGGEALDCALAAAWSLSQCNAESYLEAADEWDDDRKRRYIIAVGECGYDHDQVADDPGHDGVDIYYLDGLRDLAESLVNDGLYGEVPEALSSHIDYDSIARDLGAHF